MFKIKLSRSTNERAISKLDTLYIRSQNADNELKERKTKEKKNLEFKKHYDQTKNLDNTICSIEMIREYFESCSQRKKIEDNKEKILEVLIEKTKEGKLRYRKDLDLIKEVPSSKYISKLWCWRELSKILGLKPRPFSYSKKEIEKKYLDLKDKGKKITSRNFFKSGISLGSVIHYYGSWNNFLKEMGVEEIYEIKKMTHTKEEIVKLYKEFSFLIRKKEYGATIKDLKENNFIYKKDAILNRFSSLNDLRELAGFKRYNGGGKKYEKQDLNVLLYIEYNKLGRTLTLTEIKNNEQLPPVTLLFRYYKTTKISEIWNQVLGFR